MSHRARHAAVLLLAAIGLLPGCVLAGPEVTVAHDDYGVTATVRYPGQCVASLSHAPRGKVLRYRNECEPALAANLRTLGAMRAALFGPASLPTEITQLDAGRLVMTWPEVALRLALAAHASPDWDAARASRNDGYANAFVRDLANRQRIFDELDGLLGREVTLASVEKVLIGSPQVTPIAAALRAHGVGAAERLPFDAQAWLQLHPLTSPAGSR